MVDGWSEMTEQSTQRNYGNVSRRSDCLQQKTLVLNTVTVTHVGHNSLRFTRKTLWFLIICFDLLSWWRVAGSAACVSGDCVPWSHVRWAVSHRVLREILWCRGVLLLYQLIAAIDLEFHESLDLHLKLCPEWRVNDVPLVCGVIPRYLKFVTIPSLSCPQMKYSCPPNFPPFLNIASIVLFPLLNMLFSVLHAFTLSLNACS